MRKHTIEHVRREFEKQGFKLLTNIYVDAHQQLKYRCKCKSVRYTSFNNFLNGRRCMKCHLMELHKDAANRKFKLNHRADLFTINDLAKVLCVRYSDLWQAIKISKIIPLPTHTCGSVRKYYSAKDVDKILAKVELEEV